MTDYQIGDKVRVIAAEDTERYTNGEILTVSDGSHHTGGRYVMVICADGNQELAYLREIEPYAPDVITINRADLPEVTVINHQLLAGKNTFGRFLDADGHRQMALSQLAVAEYLAHEKTAESKRAKRRDELANELAPRAYDHMGANWYGNVGDPLRKAIDRIIDLEDAQ